MAVLDRPGSREARQELETWIGDLLEADPGLAAAAAGVLGRYYRQQLDCGDGQALAELGDLLWWDEPQLAATAFERAAAVGNDSALIRLAKHRWMVLEDYGGALPLYQQVIASPDPGVAAEALTGLGQAHRALCQLANLLERRGDSGEAKAAWQQVLDTDPAGDHAEQALAGLLNQLGSDGDLDGLRAAHQAGVAAGNRWAPYALVVIGRVLKDRGDPGGWRDAWQQAIDAGYEDAEDLLRELSPPADDEDEERAGVPPGFDPQNMGRTGIAVLANGLPSLPEPLTHRMAVPMAYWAARDTAVVLFPRFHRHRRTWHPAALMVTFTRQDGEWKADTHWHGTSFHDPFADPGGLHGLDGRPIASSGAFGGVICHGTAAPAVNYLALIQDGHEDRRPLDNHFGAWVIRTEKAGPVAVAALDENGTTLAQVQLSDP